MAKRMTTDWILFFTVTALVALGLVMVYSSTSVIAERKFNVSPTHFVAFQLGWAVVSFVALMMLKRMDYTRLRRPEWAFGLISFVIFLLIVVYFIDGRAHRWIRLPIGSLQPSEFAKPALVVFLAFFLTWRGRALNDRRFTLGAALLVVGFLFAVVALGDLGTAVVLAATAGLVFFVAGLDRKYITMALAIGMLVVTVAIASKPFRVGRLIAFFDPEYKVLDQIDSSGTLKTYVKGSSSVADMGYQGRQAKLAIGSGGVLGLGVMNGKQKIFYLPEPHTDYIYAVVGEELGLWGSSAVLFGFFIILWRGFRLFLIAPDDFGRYLALGITSMLVFQALFNITVVLGLGPTKGIPLPFISYGGSSMLSTLMSVGILLSVSERAG